MKKVYYGLLSFVLLMVLSCSKDDSQNSFQGRIDVNINSDKSLSNDASRGGEEIASPDVSDFALKIESVDGEVANSWDRFEKFQPVSVEIGSYNVTASYGDANAEGFDALSYLGSTTVEVVKDETAEASVMCTINKAKVSVSYSDDFKSYFTSYSAYINSSRGNKVTYASDETRGAYFVPGDLELYLVVARPGVSQTITLNPKNFNAEVKHDYHLTMDVDASSASLKIIFNDDPSSEQNVEINISDENLNASAPVFTAYGFNSGESIEVVEGGNVSDRLEAYLNAPSGLAKCELVTVSESLKKEGWPESVDLMNLTAEQSQKLSELGLETKGMGSNHDKIALVNFKNVIPNLYCMSEENDIHTFTLRATDIISKVSEDLVLSVTTRNNGFAVALPEYVPYGSSTMTAELTLEGDPSLVKFYYWGLGVYQEFTAENVNIQSGAETNKFTVTFTYPNSLIDTENGVKFKAKYGAKTIEDVFKVEDPDLALSLKNGDADVWATKAYLQVTASAKARSSRTISSSTVEIQYKDGEEWKVWPNQSYDSNTGLFLLTGMGEGATENAGVSYTLRAAYKRGGEVVSFSNELNIVTEVKAQVGNSGFEDWYSEKVWEKFGLANASTCRTSIYSFYPYISSEADKWWSTTNALTTQAKGDYSWYYAAYAGVIPTNATETHTASWHIKQYGNASDFGIAEITEEMLDKPNSGNTAMEIATVGWGKNNWTSQSNAQNGCKTRSAGYLFIGTYDINSGMNLGHSFNSRPYGFTFAYKFYPYASETAKAYIKVYNGDTEIGTGEYLINTATPTFTNPDNNVVITYTDLTKRATKITIVFISSTAESPQTLAIGGSENAWWGYCDSRHIGSILTVDDVKLIYE